MERFLLFDSSCAVCKKLAQAIEAETNGQLATRSLNDPKMQTLLDLARPNWRREPTLLEIDGDHIRVSTGLTLRLRLVIGLGPRQAWRIARLVRQAGVPLTGVNLGRRSFLQRSGMLLAGLAMLGFKPGSPQQKPQAQEPKNNGRHPLRDIEVEESARLSGEEAEVFRQKALDSDDIGHIKNKHTFNTEEAVVYRHELTDGNRAWIVAFAAPDQGFVAYYLFDRPVEWLQSQAAYYRIEGKAEEGEGTAYLIAMSINGQEVKVLGEESTQSSCDGCQGAQFNFDCEGCAEIDWGCVASFCGACWFGCLPSGPLVLPCTVACCGISLFAVCCEVWGATCCSCFGG